MVRLDMTLSAAELRRVLPAAVAGPFTEEEDGCRGGEGPRTWRVRIAPLPPLVLGALRLDRVRVDLTFQGFSALDENAFLDHFRAATQRGGG